LTNLNLILNKKILIEETKNLLIPCCKIEFLGFLPGMGVVKREIAMNLYIDVLIKDINANLPEFLRPRDLVSCGLYRSRSDICWAMKRGQAPPSIKLTSHKIVFPRASLCEWLKEKANLGGELSCIKD
jgi:predicted DNA-binding transcriptional regulator AlpA